MIIILRQSNLGRNARFALGLILEHEKSWWNAWKSRILHSGTSRHKRDKPNESGLGNNCTCISFACRPGLLQGSILHVLGPMVPSGPYQAGPQDAMCGYMSSHQRISFPSLTFMRTAHGAVSTASILVSTTDASLSGLQAVTIAKPLSTSLINWLCVSGAGGRHHSVVVAASGESWTWGSNLHVSFLRPL